MYNEKTPHQLRQGAVVARKSAGWEEAYEITITNTLSNAIAKVSVDFISATLLDDIRLITFGRLIWLR